MSHLLERAQLPNQGTSDSSQGLPESSQPLCNQAQTTVLVSNTAGGAAQPSSSQTASSHSSHRIRRRNRIITSCLECRRRKLKCDKLHPCTNCAKFVRDCVFLAPALDSASRLKLAEIKEKTGVLERGLVAEVANAKKQQRLQLNGANASVEKGNKPTYAQRVSKGSIDLPGELSHQQSDEDEDGAVDVPEGEKDLEPTPLAAVDAAYDDDADDDILDLGVKMGKMRMTERLGGYFRPRMTDELSFTLNLSRSEGQPPEEQGGPVPPISPLSLPHLQRAWKGKKSSLEPGPTYIAPGSGFFFGNPGVGTSIIDFLPSRLAGDSLIKQYHNAVHFIARVVHWPSFQSQYDNFWANITVGIEPSGSLQAVVFAVMFSAVVSMNENDITTLFSVPKSNLMASFQNATEVALGKANFLRTTKLETLQGLVIYLIPMCRDEMSRAHSVLVGTAIRLAECMGLHNDPQRTYILGPLESHTRRTLWCQICFLDIRTTEAQGPRPLIRRDDFDSSFPLNVNDADLISGNPEESNGWTDMTFSKIRFECNEMHRVIWMDRSRLEKKQIGLTHVLGKIESFRKAMEAKYHPIIDENVPLQKEAKIVMNLLLLKMHIMVLHRYHTSSRVRIPDRLRQITLSTGTQQMEEAIRLGTDPVLQPWAWYCGAYQQWHTAFLLLVEVFSFPMRQESDRIWRVLDYVFETDPSMTREQKGRAILSGLRDLTGAYREFRKMRAPVNMISRIYAPSPPKPDDDQVTNLPLNFNSDPTPPASRSAHRPPLAYHLLYGPVEYPNTVHAEHDALSQPSNKHSPQSQGQSRSPFNSSYAVTSITAVAPPATASFGQMTKKFADAPSPISSTDSLHNQNWTFDAPSNFFVRQSHPNKHPKTLPGEQTTQNSPPLTSATGSADNYPNPSIPIMPGHIPAPDVWSGGAGAGDVAYSMHPQQEPGVGAINSGIVSPTSNASGGSMEMKGIVQGISPQAAGVTGMEPDMMMVDIDWSEWDKIFPPEVNTGVLNTPVPQPF